MLRSVGTAVLALVVGASVQARSARGDAGSHRDVAEDAAPLSEQGLENVIALARAVGVIRYFHPSDEAAALDWRRFTVAAIEPVENADSSEDLVAVLRELFAPIAPTVQFDTAAPEAIDETPPPEADWAYAWHHQGFGLADYNGGVAESKRVRRGLGSDPDPPDLAREDDAIVRELAPDVWFRVPLCVFGAGDATLPSPLDEPRQARDVDALSRSVRLAASMLAWNVFEHFFVYFDDIDCDWPAMLPLTLQRAATAGERELFLETLELLVAELRDGHAAVNLEGALPAFGLPFVWEWIEERAVLTAVAESSDGTAWGTPGDEVLAINGVLVVKLIGDRERRISASTPHYRRTRAMLELTYRRTDGPVELTLRAPDGAERKVTLQPTPADYWAWAPTTSRGPRPDQFAELRPGILYVDVNTLSREEFEAVLPKLVEAEGIVFDVRYYPRNMYYPEYVPHLIGEAFDGMLLASTTFPRPGREGLRHDFKVWRPEPKTPAIHGEVVLLSHRAGISSCESHLALARAGAVGTIVGETTGGTNGNAFNVALPGRCTLSFTGIRVERADHERLYGVGIHPHVRVRRTVAGIAAGRDEILERGLEILESRLGR